MYGNDTFAIEVSSNSMKVARVTVSAMNHGLTECGFTAGFSVDMVWLLKLVSENPQLPVGTYRAATGARSPDPYRAESAGGIAARPSRNFRSHFLGEID